MFDLVAFRIELSSLLRRYNVMLVCSDPYEWVEFVVYPFDFTPDTCSPSVNLEDGSSIERHVYDDITKK